MRSTKTDHRTRFKTRGAANCSRCRARSRKASSRRMAPSVRADLTRQGTLEERVHSADITRVPSGQLIHKRRTDALQARPQFSIVPTLDFPLLVAFPAAQSISSSTPDNDFNNQLSFLDYCSCRWAPCHGVQSVNSQQRRGSKFE
jgi:hypothetical protein